MPSAKGPKQNAKQKAKLPAKLVAAIAAKKGPKQIKKMPKKSKLDNKKGLKTKDLEKLGGISKGLKTQSKEFSKLMPVVRPKSKDTYNGIGVSGSKQKMMPPKQKSRKKIAQDYARNAIADGDTKAGKYEKKMAVKEAAGEGPGMYGKAPKMKGPYMESNAQEKKNLMMDDPIDTRASMGGPKMKAGSWMSKHTKSRM